MNAIPGARPTRGAVWWTRTLAPPLAVLVAMLPALTCAPAEAPPVEEDALNSLVSQEARFFEVMAGAPFDSGDPEAAGADTSLRAEALTAFFAPDAVLHVAGMAPVEGVDAIRAFYTNLFRFLQASRPTPQRAEVEESGELAFTLGATTNVFAGPEGPQEYRGKYAMVWRQVDGEWMVVLYSVSGDAP